MLDIRNDFPLIKNYNQDGRLVYADSAATTQKPQCVIDALTEWYSVRNAGVHRGSYKLSALATDVYEYSRKVVADFIHGEQREVVFCRNATEALNLVVNSFAAAVLKSGDEIVLPISEHHSNLIPWQNLARRKDCKLTFLLLDRKGRLPEAELEKINSRTKFVAIAAMSNVLGTKFPIKRIVERAHAVGAYVVVDDAQGMLHERPDVKAWDADFLAFSGHKVLAPEGIGVLWGRYDLLERMQPVLWGGEMVDRVSWRKASCTKPPMRFEAGTQNAAGAFALSVALNYMEALGCETIAEHENVLLDRLLTGMRDIPGLKIYGNPEMSDDRGPVVAFNFAGQNPLLISRFLDSKGITIRIGTHCAQPLMEYMGVNGACRISLAPYNTEEDADYILDVLRQVPEMIFKTVLRRKK